VIETDFIWFTAEENSGADFVLIKIECAKGARVIERFEDLEFLKGRAADGFVSPGPQATWVKVENPRYSEGEGRRELFERHRSRNLTHNTKT